MHGVHTVRVLGSFHRLTHLLDGKCICFQVVKRMTFAHIAMCPLALSTMSLSWLLVGINVTYT